MKTFSDIQSQKNLSQTDLYYNKRIPDRNLDLQKGIKGTSQVHKYKKTACCYYFCILKDCHREKKRLTYYGAYKRWRNSLHLHVCYSFARSGGNKY